MKKYIIIIIALLYSFLSANLLFAVPFVQSDLAGTWHINMLRTGIENKWVRAKMTIDSSGAATCVSMSDSTGVITCPGSFDLTLIMDPSTGVITQTGDDAVGDGGHMTMTSNKKFAAGTGTNSDNQYQLMIIQKEVTGTSYGNSDLVSKNFVIHELMVGGQNEWMHDVGYTDASREVWFTSQTRPSGTDNTLTDSESTISVDSNGIVSISGPTMTTYQGFMSDDKKTIVGTLTDGEAGSECYHLMIIQITGQTYAAGQLPAGTLFSHVLGNGAGAFWVHYTQTVDSSGVMTFSDWLNSAGETTAPDPFLTGNIDASGTVTIDGNSTFHGQVSHDRTFTVSTHTRGTGPFFYMLSVSTKATSTTLYADFPGAGVYQYNGTTWSQVTPNSPEAMVVSGSTLYGDFGSSGIWMYNGTTWSQATPSNPQMMTVSGSTLYGAFSGGGIWMYSGTTWSQTTPSNPEAILASGSNLYGDFGSSGIWVYNGTTWSQTTPSNPQMMTVSGSTLYGAFSGAGIWMYNGTTWSQTTPSNPEAILTSGSNLYGDFGSSGIWIYNGTTWSQLSPLNPEQMVCTATDLYADLGNAGIWIYNGTTWSQVTPNDPANMVVPN